jgi:hypothetical protein
MTATAPNVIWRLVGEDEFPLEALLRLLFGPDAEHDERREGADARPA